MNLRLQLLAASMPLLSLVPVALYAVGRETIAAVALVNVLIVAASMYLMFSRAEGEHHGSAAH